MRTALALALLAIPSCFPQQAGSEDEQVQLRLALAEAGSSPVDLIRALENHLARFPASSQRPDMESAIVKAALDTKDDRRILLYGERVLAREPDDILLLERVSRALLSRDDEQSARKALQYARRLQAALDALEKEHPPKGSARLQMREQLDRSSGKALVYQARAAGNLGQLEAAVSLARKSYQIYPAAESAREIGRWLARLGNNEEALRHIADAFVIGDPDNSPAHRAKDRARLREIYLQAHGSEAGLGDIILQAYDRTTALLEQRRLALRQLDPNVGLTDPMEFTVSGLDGEKLELSSLKGKVVILDFWATWCGPCRAQQPLYEEVEREFRDRNDVVFLNINTDEDRDIVKPFLDKNKWNKTVYFEDGLSRALRVSSIPTTIIIGRNGDMTSRMNGFIPERFVDMLTERIRQALAESSQ